MTCGVVRRCASDLALLWLWHRLATVGLIRLLAWEPPYATGAALKRPKKKKDQKKTKKKKEKWAQSCSLWFYSLIGQPFVFSIYH